MDPEIQKLLDEGIASLRAERKEEAQSKLMQVIEADERNEYAWLYLSEAVDNDEDRQICLENVLAINPANERAETELKALEERMAREAATAGVICPACGTTNPSGSQRCLNCYADLGEAIATPPPLPGEFPQVEGAAQEPPPREVKHKGLMEMLDTWAEVLGLPKQERLDEEHAYARWGLIVPGVLVASGIAYFFISLTNVGTTLLLPGSAPDPVQLLPRACGGAVGGAVLGLVSFFIYSGLFYVVARLFQGRGEFVVQSYLLSLVYGPYSLVAGIISPLALLGALNTALSFIPALLMFPLSILMLIMLVRALKSAHGYGTGAALGTLFLPGIVLSCIGILVVSLVAGGLLAALPLAIPSPPTEMPVVSPTPTQQPAPPVGGEPRADVPVPEEANVTISSATTIEYDIFQSPEAVGIYYQTQMPLQGWTPDSPNIVEAERILLAYAKPGASVLIQASRAGDRTRVIINISEF